jgi:hypothetical protein
MRHHPSSHYERWLAGPPLSTRRRPNRLSKDLISPISQKSWVETSAERHARPRSDAVGLLRSVSFDAAPGFARHLRGATYCWPCLPGITLVELAR